MIQKLGSCDGRHARLSGSLWRTLEGRYGRSEFGIRSLLVKRLGLDGLARAGLGNLDRAISGVSA
jgi:hypothetical protein